MEKVFIIQQDDTSCGKRRGGRVRWTRTFGYGTSRLTCECVEGGGIFSSPPLRARTVGWTRWWLRKSSEVDCCKRMQVRDGTDLGSFGAVSGRFMVRMNRIVMFRGSVRQKLLASIHPPCERQTKRQASSWSNQLGKEDVYMIVIFRRVQAE